VSTTPFGRFEVERSRRPLGGGRLPFDFFPPSGFLRVVGLAVRPVLLDVLDLLTKLRLALEELPQQELLLARAAALRSGAIELPPQELELARVVHQAVFERRVPPLEGGDRFPQRRDELLERLVRRHEIRVSGREVLGDGDAYHLRAPRSAERPRRLTKSRAVAP